MSCLLNIHFAIVNVATDFDSFKTAEWFDHCWMTIVPFLEHDIYLVGARFHVLYHLSFNLYDSSRWIYFSPTGCLKMSFFSHLIGVNLLSNADSAKNNFTVSATFIESRNT